MALGSAASASTPWRSMRSRSSRRRGARQSIVPSESGSKAITTRASPTACGELVVPLHRAAVLGQPTGEVVAAAGAALVAHDDHQRHRAGLVALHAIQEAAHLLLHARAGEAAKPAKARLARQAPDRVGLVGLSGALPLAPGHVCRLHAVHEVLGAHERVRRRRVDRAHVEVPRVHLRGRRVVLHALAQSSGYSPIGPGGTPSGGCGELGGHERALGVDHGLLCRGRRGHDERHIRARSIGPKRVILLT